MAYQVSGIIISYNNKTVCYWLRDRQISGIEWRTRMDQHIYGCLTFDRSRISNHWGNIQIMVLGQVVIYIVKSKIKSLSYNVYKKMKNKS